MMPRLSSNKTYMMKYTIEHRSPIPIPSQNFNVRDEQLLPPAIIPEQFAQTHPNALKPYATEATSEPSSRFDARSSESTVL